MINTSLLQQWKVITNYISHKIDAKYIIPTRINMEDGLKSKLIDDK